jgi:hypothetical protein
VGHNAQIPGCIASLYHQVQATKLSGSIHSAPCLHAALNHTDEPSAKIVQAMAQLSSGRGKLAREEINNKIL